MFSSAICKPLSEFEYARECIGIGVVEYLLKPVSGEEVKGCLQKVIAQLDGEILCGLSHLLSNGEGDEAGQTRRADVYLRKRSGYSGPELFRQMLQKIYRPGLFRLCQTNHGMNEAVALFFMCALES